MYRRTIDFGIDLGTTNSAIACITENGPKIMKSDSQSDTTPSCIYYTKSGQCLAGTAAVNRMRMDLVRGILDSALAEFKTKMGTDHTYSFPAFDELFTPEDLSAQILKTLKTYVHGEDVRAAVIAVPAAFGQNQIEATQKAGELAGFEQVELIPEPLAASLAYALDKKGVQGHWLVFDLGGGTFDAVLMSMHEGIMKVVDIAGDRSLGGKDMDYLIVDKIIIPQLRKHFSLDNLLSDGEASGRFRRLIKNLYAEDAKIRLSAQEAVDIEIADELGKDDEDKTITDVSVSLTRVELERLVAPMLDRAIGISRDVCKKNNVDPVELSAVLLIGGPTFMPCVRERLKKELCSKIDTSVDPMTAVALGAALYAATVQNKTEQKSTATSGVRLLLAFPETTVEPSVTVAVKAEKPLATGSTMEIVASDGRWKSGRISLKNSAGAVQVPLVTGQSNGFTVSLFDPSGNRRACEPDRFTILHGVKIDSVPLPFDICAEVVVHEEGGLLKAIAHRGDVLPVTGIMRNLKTRSVLRPGEAEDVLTIPVYEGEEYTRPLYNRYIGELKITGDQVDSLVPAGSDVTVTMRIDASRRKLVSAYIECIDQTFEGVMQPLQKASFDSAEVEHSIEQASQRLDALSEAPGLAEDVLELTQDLDKASVNFEIAGMERDGLESAADMVKELHKKLDALEKTKAREIAAGAFLKELDIVTYTVTKEGTDDHKNRLRAIQDQVSKAVEALNSAQIHGLTVAAREIYWDIKNRQPSYWICSFQNFSRTFDAQRWTNEPQARSLLSRGRDILSHGYDESLRQVVCGLRSLNREDAGEVVRMDVLEAK